MKSLIICLFLLIGVNSFATELSTDGRGVKVQGASPDGLLSATLMTSYTHDMTNYVWWGVYCTADCKGRLMPTSSKDSYPQFTIPGGSWYGEVRNKNTPFVNISGAHEWKQQ